MGTLTPPEHRRIAVSNVKTAAKWILWTPFFISILALLLFALARLVIGRLPEKESYLKRWRGLRDWLAVKTSGGEFFDVYSQNSSEQTTSTTSLLRGQPISVATATPVNMETSQSHHHERVSNVTREKDLFMADRLILATAKGSWYNLYLLLLPVQVVLITILIVHNIYDEEYHSDSCESFAKIAGNLNESRFYDCSYRDIRENNSEIWKECNNTQNSDDKINCSVYYYNPLLSQIILTVLNTLLLHVTLAKGFVRVMILLRYIVHKLNKTFFDKCPKKEEKINRGAITLAVSLVIILAIPFILYAINVDASDLTTIMVFFAYTATVGSIVLFLFGLAFQEDLYERFSKCVYNVTADPKLVENSQPSRSCFCCLSKRTTSRDNYEEVQ